MIPLPSALYLYVAVAIGAAAAGGTTAWTVQKWRYTGQIASIKLEHAQAVTDATREARATESRRFKEVQDAQANATKRAQVARADSAAANTELSRLRDAIRTRAVCVPGDTAGAGPVGADTAGQLLYECSGAYQDLAAQADRLNADRLMLLEAWPR